MFKDDSNLLRMSIYRPKKQGYRYKQLYAKYGRYAQNSSSEVLSAHVRSPEHLFFRAPDQREIQFSHDLSYIQTMCTKWQNNGNMSLELYKILF